jgi:hypothetical protein
MADYSWLTGPATKFIKSGIGQTAIGAGLGYGADRLMGGKGGMGALVGGIGGLANAFSGGSGNFMADRWTGSELDNATTGLASMFGQSQGQRSIDDYLQQANTAGADNAFTAGEATGLRQGYEALLANQPTSSSGLAGTLSKGFDSLSRGYGSNKELIDTGLKGYKVYSEAKDAKRKADLAQREINEQAKINAYNIAQAKAANERRRKTGAGARSGFAASSMLK